jgi:uncharacterized membrane protein
MKTFVEQLDAKRIESAIASAERLTSGEFRVVIDRKAVTDPVASARDEFARLEMYKTRERNAVLIFVAPESHKFAIFGDEAIHAKCGQPFWDDVTAAMTVLFREGKFTDGLVHAIDHAGQFLAKHFPRQPNDKNELPDSVIDRGNVI